jgi:hypothetical protein
MKLSSASVFFVLLGLFMAFTLFSHLKIRLTESMANYNESTEPEEKKPRTRDFPSPDYEYRPPVETAYRVPDFLLPFNRVKIVEPMDASEVADEAFDYEKLKEKLLLDGKDEFNCADEKGKIVRSSFGCCENGSPMTDKDGSNCKDFVKPAKSCKQVLDRTTCITTPIPYSDGTTMCKWNMNTSVCETFDPSDNIIACYHGSCPRTMTCKVDAVGSNCSEYPPDLPQTCVASIYGCCPDGSTTKNADGSNCLNKTTTTRTVSELTNLYNPTPVEPTEMYPGVTPYNTSTVLIPPPIGGASVPKSETVKDQTPKQESPQQESPKQESNMSSCPPCPGCARCPEPSFECKKVPNYERTDNERFVPQAVLTDFSSFGM